MLSKPRKLEDKPLQDYPHTGPMGHSEPIGYKIVEDNSSTVTYEKEKLKTQ